MSDGLTSAENVLVLEGLVLEGLVLEGLVLEGLVLEGLVLEGLVVPRASLAGTSSTVPSAT